MIAENTVPSPEMVGMITSVLVKTAPEREDSETRTVFLFFFTIIIFLNFCFSTLNVLHILAVPLLTTGG